MTDLATIPAIRAEAERLARVLSDATVAAVGARNPTTFYAAEVVATLSLVWRDVVEGHVRMLADMSNPASRDAIARLGAAREIANYHAVEDPKWAAIGARIAAGEWHEDVAEAIRSGNARIVADAERSIRAKWNALRDDPEQLAIIARRVLGGEE